MLLVMDGLAERGEYVCTFPYETWVKSTSYVNLCILWRSVLLWNFFSFGPSIIDMWDKPDNVCEEKTSVLCMLSLSLTVSSWKGLSVRCCKSAFFLTLCSCSVASGQRQLYLSTWSFEHIKERSHWTSCLFKVVQSLARNCTLGWVQIL